GGTQWAVATPFRPDRTAPLERVAVNLTHNADTVPERSLKLSSKFELKGTKGSREVTLADTAMSMEVLEILGKGAKGTDIRLALGKGEFSEETGGQRTARAPAVQNLVRKQIYNFTANPTGRIIIFGTPVFNPKIPLDIRRSADDLAEIFTN